MPHTRSNVRFGRGERRPGAATIQYFKAKGDGTADDRQAFVDGIAELAADGGGDLHVSRGYYRCTNGFTVAQGVNLRLAQGAVLQLDHPTADFITLSTDNSAADTVISGGIFEAVVANTGRVFVDPAGSNGRSWRLDGVNINTLGAQLRGPLLEQLGNSSIGLRGCKFIGANLSNAALVRQNNSTAYMSIEGGSIIAPSAAWNGQLLLSSNGRGQAEGVHFDLQPAQTNGSTGFWLNSTQQPWQLNGNRFSAPAFSVSGMRWTAGAHLVEYGNVFAEGSFPAGAYDSSNGALAVGSRLELHAASAVLEGASSPISIPKGYRTYNLRRNSSTAVQLVLPTGWFAGQELLLTYFNDTASAVNVSFATTPLTADPVSTLTAGQTLTGVLVWEDRDVAGGTTPGSRWVLKGAWGYGGTRV